MITAEQFVKSQKSNADTFSDLAGKAFQGCEKLITLNTSAFKAALTDAGQATQAVLSVKDAQGLIALQQSLLQPAREKAAEYSRSVYEIAASTVAELTRVAEVQAAEAQAKFESFLDTGIKNAPAGTENGVALIKSAVAASNNAIEVARKAAKQAAEVAEANFQAVTKPVVRAARTGSKAKRMA